MSEAELAKYQAEYAEACEMRKEWNRLQTDSVVLDDILVDTKDTFAELSTAQVSIVCNREPAVPLRLFMHITSMKFSMIGPGLFSHPAGQSYAGG